MARATWLRSSAWLLGSAILVASSCSLYGCAAGGDATTLDNPGGGGSGGGETDAKKDNGGDVSTSDSQGDVSSDNSQGGSGGGDSGGGGGTGGAAGSDAGDASDASDASDAPVGCSNDGDCSGSPLGAFCDLGDGGPGVCVECLPSNDQCPAGEYCTTGNTCTTGCKTTTDCGPSLDGGTDAAASDSGAALSCDPQTHQCVGCVTDNDCPAGTLCTANACVPGCNAQHACQTGKDCCTGLCFDLQKDTANCGACANACPTPANGVAGCSAGTCGISKCNTGFADCDTLAADGCEINTNTSAQNCGACATPCTLPNAASACSAGSCTITTCTSGWADCDTNPATGCEVQTSSDALHCGSCTNTCAVSHGTAACTASQCEIAGCDSGYGDCDTLYSTGCEINLNTNAKDCGFCGSVCTLANANAVCTTGQCAVGSCTLPYADCDKNPNNGCEVNTNSNVQNCGGCGAACAYANAGATCTTGTCGLGACLPGWGNCDANDATGCETNTKNDVNNCSDCNIVCNLPHANPACTNGSCQILSCNAPYQDCDNTDFDGCEINTSTNINNCGGCGIKCALANATNTCSAGACGISACTSGYANCNAQTADGCEVATTTDVKNCGGCGTACTVANGTPNCTNSACQVAACNPGYQNCNNSYADGCETNVNTDINNCGKCGGACTVANGTPTCSAGACALAACNGGFADCNGLLSDGCEVNLKTLTNCGTCGIACSPPNTQQASCSTGACAIVSCASGWADCDGNVANGCEVNITNDVNHCGACTGATAVCGVANGSPTCVTGACKVGACNPGFGDCDAQYANGCETNVKTSVSNCGTCGTACALSHVATDICSSGNCGVGTCLAGYGDCDGTASNGCEVQLNTTTNCAGCGIACTTPNASATCATGACAVASCNAGFANCDGNVANGCEVNTQTDVFNCNGCGNICTASGGATPACVAGACKVATCPAGTGDCDGITANGCETTITNNVADCGGCGVTCAVANGTPKCTNTTCGVSSCSSGFADCDGQYANGCETNLHTLANCGACGTTCALANATSTCATGTCAISACNGGFANCDNNAANGCEVNTSTSLSNCGACGTACAVANGTPTCNTGNCAVQSCNSGFQNCNGLYTDGCEINTNNDINNCGGCGIKCSAAGGSPVCSAGVCGIACAPGFGNCNGIIADGCETALTSLSNCGACGTTCNLANATSTCATGTCAIATCNGGFGNCDGNVGNGCETNVQTDANNCSACGTKCTFANATAACTAGSCGISACNSGFANCNGVLGDGCEINTNTNTSNCGACGSACSGINMSSSTCTGGACTGTCAGGFGDCDANLKSNGCETNLTNTVTHCGTCATNCTAPVPPATTGETCTSSVCKTTSCSLNYYDTNGTFSDGCECQADAIADSCGSAQTVSPNPVPQGVSPAVTWPASGSYDIVPAGDQDYFQVNFDGNWGCGFHPKVVLNDLGNTGKLRMDVTQDCSGTPVLGAGSCSDGGSSLGVTSVEYTYNPGCGGFGAAIDASRAPMGPTTIYVRVYSLSAASTCLNYTLTITNG